MLRRRRLIWRQIPRRPRQHAVRVRVSRSERTLPPGLGRRGNRQKQPPPAGRRPVFPPSPPSPTAFTLAIKWDSSVSAAPAGFTADILAAANYLETQFTDPITITIDVGYNEVDGNLLAGGTLGESLSNFSSVSYANLLGAVKADARTTTDTSFVASLPATSPVSGATYWVTTAQSKALGLTASNTSVDGYVGFGTSSQFTYGDTATSGSVAAGTYDFFATAVHLS